MFNPISHVIRYCAITQLNVMGALDPDDPAKLTMTREDRKAALFPITCMY